MNPDLTENQNRAASTWTPSEKVQRLLADHNSSPPSLGAERAIHYTEFDKKEASKYSSAHIRRAKSLAYHLQKRTIHIHDDEIIVGSHTEHRIGAICHVEFAGNVMLEDIFKFETRRTNPLHVDPASKRILTRKVIPYWLTRNLLSTAFPTLTGLKYMVEQLNASQFIINEAGGIAHFLPDFGELIRLGTDGLRQKIDLSLKDETKTHTSINALNANLIALEALEQFAKRYRNLAATLGRDDLVDVLTKVPKKPANNLREALQLIWLFQLVIQIESLDQGISLGRIDQYLYPLYLKEKEEGIFDEDAFKNMFCALCVKMSEIIPLFSSRVTEYFGGLPTGQALTIGGIDEKGADATNNLSFMLLDVLDKFKTRQPNWHARISKVSNPDFVQDVMRIISRGGGSPALYNDDVIVSAMKKRGYQDDSVWNYGTVGCVEPALSGESFTSSDAALFNLPLVLEMILGEGSRLTKNFQLGIKKKRKNRKLLKFIKDMDELMGEVAAEMKYQVGYMRYCLDRIEEANARYFPTPFSSLTVKGCIESGRDLSEGGALYNASGIQGVGLADLADSMAAIEEVVFGKKEVTLKELASACKNNFKNSETLRARLLKVAKFGNDDERTDGYARKLSKLFDSIISENRNTRGGQWMSGFYSMTCHRGMGKHTAALPSGRLKGESLADGIAPTDGSDVLGPTAMLNSITSLDHEVFGNGVNLNIKFDAGTIRGEKGAAILQSLIGGYFDQGGMQSQINVLDPAVLMMAQRNPEKHQNLLVRISGYCAYFVDLTPEMQNEIIQRTLQAV
ncbi:MAG: formate acetyltransferase [Chloroflexi bacterium]|nr:formate acetyltransferase [Chloroflexota bacterium]